MRTNTQLESFHLRPESNLDGEGYHIRLNHSDGESEVHMEWPHDWFFSTQQQRVSDSYQVQPQRLHLSSDSRIFRGHQQFREHIDHIESNRRANHERC